MKRKKDENEGEEKQNEQGNRSPKRQKNDLPTLSALDFISQLPYEIFFMIMEYVPGYHFMGKKALHGVSHLWHWLLKLNPSLVNQKRSKRALIGTCHTQEDALQLISNATACKQLSFSELLEIAGKHPSLTEFILLNYKRLFRSYFYGHLISQEPAGSESDLIKLGKHDFRSAKIILAAFKLKQIGPTPLSEVADEFEKFFRLSASLSQYHSSLAWELLTSSDKNLLEPDNLVMPGKNDIKIAQYILKEKTLRDKLDTRKFIDLIKRHPSLIEQFFDYKNLLREDNTLNDMDCFIKDPSLKEGFLFFHLFLLGEFHLGFAQTILKMPVAYLTTQITEERTLENFRFTKAIYDYDLICSHKEIALDILKNHHDLRDKLGIAHLCQHHTEIAWDVLNDPNRVNKLTGMDLLTLASIDNEIAWHIFNQVDLRKRIEGMEAGFVTFACLHFDIAQKISSMPDLYNLIFKQDAMTVSLFNQKLANMHLETAERSFLTLYHHPNKIEKEIEMKEKIDLCNGLIKEAQSLLSSGKQKTLPF